MAIAVPLIMGATGASAAIAGALGVSATAVGIGTSLALAATGIGSKVDKAAANVFGKDLVNVGNIAGAAYGAFGGGFDGSSDMFGSAPPTSNIAATAASSAPFDASGTESSVPRITAADADAMNAMAKPAASVAGSPVKGDGSPAGVTAGVKKFWGDLGDKGQGALLQVGGNLLAGVGQGAAKAKELDLERQFKLDQDARYRSGSGLNTFGPPGALRYYQNQPAAYIPPWKG